MTVERPLGLALSGGGFRASAFHLGVLKRLRELGLLEQVDIVSTVSGGSITGAYWVYWQALRGDTLGEQEEWERFESSLIGFMHSGAREWVLWRGFWIPFLLLGLPAVILAWRWSGVWRPWPAWGQLAALLALASAVFALAYTSWHYLASRLFQARLNRELFRNKSLFDLSPRERHTRPAWPHLVVNATGLNSGDHLLFTPQPPLGSPGWKLLSRVLPDTSGIPASPQKRPRTQARYTAPRVSLGLDTPLARGVAASCAIPSVFAPLRVQDPQPWWETPSWWPGRFLAVDGGVNDNQGTQVLLDGRCHGVIVSDAAGALRTQPYPSSWQLLPPGQGVIFRSQNIIYERMRDLGYQRLEERYEFTRRLREVGRLGDEELKYLPLLDAYAYVELWPSDFRWDTDVRLPQAFVPHVASIRTDLDRFSYVEISALMFHGYTMIDQCVRSFRPEWVPQQPRPLNFSSPVQDVCINWAGLTPAEHVRYLSHLVAAASRLGWYRPLRRAWLSWRFRRVARRGRTSSRPAADLDS